MFPSVNKISHLSILSSYMQTVHFKMPVEKLQCDQSFLEKVTYVVEVL